MSALFFHSLLERSQYLHCHFLDPSAKQLRKAANNFLMSVRPSALRNLSLAGRISMLVCSGRLYWGVSRGCGSGSCRFTCRPADISDWFCYWHYQHPALPLLLLLWLLRLPWYHGNMVTTVMIGLLYHIYISLLPQFATVQCLLGLQMSTLLFLQNLS